MKIGSMFQVFSVTKKANILGDELKEARQRIESVSSDLVKTLDEMLEATNKANCERLRHERHSKSGH